MDDSATTPDSPPAPKLIRKLEEFHCFGQWHAGWTLLDAANPGLAFAVAVLLPWNTDGLRSLHEDLDDGLKSSQGDLLRQTGLPPGDQTLRILQRFDRTSWWFPIQDQDSGWWCSSEEPDQADEARTALHILGSLLKFEPDAATYLMSRDGITPDHVIELATGLATEANSWVSSVLFRAEHIHKAAWFFQLPFVRRCVLARRFWELHGRHVGDMVTEITENSCFPRRPNLDAFRDEEHALAYSVRLRAAREKVHHRCFKDARLRPWPAHPFPGSGTIVAVRSLGEAYPESLMDEFQVYDPQATLQIRMGRICLYRMLRPIRALVVLGYCHDREGGLVMGSWELRSLLVWRTQSEARMTAATAQIERWIERQPMERRQHLAVAQSARAIMDLGDWPD